MIFPILLWTATLSKLILTVRLCVLIVSAWGTACGCAMMVSEISIKHSTLIGASQIFRWGACLCVFTLILNALVTCECHNLIASCRIDLVSSGALIIWKLWHARSAVRAIISDGPDKLKHVMRIILDSGLIYTTSVTILFGITSAQNNAQYVVSDMVAQIIVRSSFINLQRFILTL